MAFKLRFNPRQIVDELLGRKGAPVAIDFASSGLKILSITPGSPPTLECAAFVPTPADVRDDARKRLSKQFEQLPRVIADLGLKGRPAVCAIPASQTYCKHMQFARSPDVPMAVVAAGAVAQQIGCDPSAIVCQAITVGNVPGDASKSEVICTAVSRELVNLIMQATRDAKLEIAALHGEFTATTRAFDYLTRRAEDVSLSTLYLDVGEQTTKVVVARGMSVAFVRFIEFGTRTLDRLVAQKHDCSLDEASAMRRERSAVLVEEPVPAPTQARQTVGAVHRDPQTPGEIGILSLLPKDRRTSTVTAVKDDATCHEPLPELREQLEILADEVQMCVRYHESTCPGSKIERLICLGGGALDSAVCRSVARALRVPAQVADPMARLNRTGKEPCLGLDLTQRHPEWSVAMGLCLCPKA